MGNWGYICVFALLSLAAPAAPRKTLDFYFIDVEGGQATLIVTPAGESLLVDAGWPGYNGRDAGRIIDAAKHAGLKQIDYLMVTHYHLDHVGGVPDLMERFPVKNLVDHGDNVEKDKDALALTARYLKAAEGAHRMIVKAGDTIPLRGVTVTVIESGGVKVAKTLPGGGTASALCGKEEKKADDPSENARSNGILVQFGDFRFIDMGDLTWNKEIQFACPASPVGKVDLYLTNHHGMDQSNSKTLVDSLAPRVAIMNNGARKGASPSAWQIVSSAPGLEDLWQLHYAVAGGAGANVAADQIANPDEKCEGKWIEVSATENREITVRNSRNGFSKTYVPRKGDGATKTYTP
jgi:competence protein ComEC